MNTNFKKYSFFCSGALLFFLLISGANAATLSLLPKTGEFQAGKQFEVELKVNSEGQGFNAAQATILFPKDVLEVKSLDYSPAASAFNFWLESPSFSNADGKIKFIGGSTNGISGSAVSILKVTFSAKGIGDGFVTLGDAAVTASDGSGANILSTIEPATFKVVSGIVSPKSGLPEPAPITRTAETAHGLPAQPILSVPLYPDQTQWSNLVSDFLASWILPKDISGVSTALNESSQFAPAAKSEGLFESKMFGRLKNGIHYLHARFQNNLGWGPAAHYRLAVDTAPPLPFKIESADGFKTGNPAPVISFFTSDSISGIKNYQVRVDNREEIISEKGKLTLPLLGPGSHHLLVRAVDQAGNFSEDAADLEILPLSAPTTDFVTRSVSLGEFIFATGKVQPGLGLRVQLNDANGQEVFNGQATVTGGNWEILIQQPLATGKYALAATAVDKRGALSYPAESQTVKVRPQPVIAIGSLELGWFSIALIIFLLGAAGYGIFAAKYLAAKKRRGAYGVIAYRDVEKLSELLLGDIKDLEGLVEQHGESSKNKAASLIFKIRNTLSRMKGYITKEIEKIK